MAVCLLVVFLGEFIDLVNSQALLVDCKAHVSWDVLLLLPRLDVEADVDEDTILRFRVPILEHQGASQSSSDSILRFEYHVDLMLSKVLLGAIDSFGIGNSIFFNGFLSHEGVVHLGQLGFFVERDFKVT